MRLFGRALVTPVKDGLGITLKAASGQTLDMQVTGEAAQDFRNSVMAAVPATGDKMAANPGKRVVDTVQAFTKELEAHADNTLSEMGAKKELLKAKMSRTKDILIQPWDEADEYLDDYINQLTNGGPPLDD